MVLITCMLRLDVLLLWMALCREINKENKCVFLLFLHLLRNLYVIELYNNLSKKCVDLICWGLMVNHMFVMLMVGLLLNLIPNIGRIVLLFWRKRFFIIFFLINCTKILCLRDYLLKIKNLSCRWTILVLRWSSWDRLCLYLDMVIDLLNWSWRLKQVI